MRDDLVLKGQHSQWESSYLKNKDMFGESPSEAAIRAAKIFHLHGIKKILELGAGQGRDTTYLAQQGFEVIALDYTKEGTERIRQKSIALNLSDRIQVVQHDVRLELPFENCSLDACYSHMLYCMAFPIRDLETLSRQIHRVLKPGGLNIFTVRHKGDPHYGQGIHRGEDMYEVGGFIVHFFDRNKVDKVSVGYKILDINEFEEGGLPRKLWMITMKKESN
ncbi:class I SAM-dependent methyltransferase [Alicyclobacillus mali (ex Roth et al. 2021)]|nr:class I SAM-dependent methyltransferase [Alicyclobacillus mali (ex Roth et al. 2021)]